MPQTQIKTTEPTFVPIERDNTVALVTTDELLNILYQRKGSSFISFQARYLMDEKGRMRKGGRSGTPINLFFGLGIEKVSTTSGGVTFDYDAGVARRLAKESKDADEHQKGTSWSQAVTRADGTLTPLSVHKADVNDDGSFVENARVYLRFSQTKSVSHYEAPDGAIVDKSDLLPWLPPASNYKNQGLDKPLEFQTIGFDSIVSLTVDGVKYIIRRD